MRRTNRTFTVAEQAGILTAHEAGASISAQARSYDCDYKTIERVLRGAGILARPRYAIDREAFTDANQRPEAAYWIGLLMADGCISDQHSGRISLTLEARNADHIYRFRDFLKSAHPIFFSEGTRKKDGTPCRRATLVIANKALVASLAAYGVTSRKSFTARVIGLEDNPHFFRGLIDGDGCISFGRDGLPSLQLCGSLPSLEQFRAFALRFAPDAAATVHKIKGAACHAVAVSGVYAQAVIRALQYESDLASLPRKKARALRALAWEPSRNRLSEADKDEAVRRYQAGELFRVIARDFGVRSKTIRRTLRERGVKTRHGNTEITDAQKATIVSDYKGYGDIPRLALRLGLEHETVRKVLHAAGVSVKKTLLSSDQVAEAVRRYRSDARETLASIATPLHIHPATLRLILIREGVVLRKVGKRQ
jgi:transposase-like protein